MTISHEERRNVLTTQHMRLRDQIAVLRARANAVLAQPEKEADGSGLMKLIVEFGAELEAHLATEESLLGPVLERIDAWGPVRLEVMKAEHAHQRSVLEMLRSNRVQQAHLVARRALSLTDDILLDMDREDRDLLDARVLRDDIVQLDASDA